MFRGDATSQVGRVRSRSGLRGLVDDVHHRERLFGCDSAWQHIYLGGGNRCVACCSLEMCICRYCRFLVSSGLKGCDRLFLWIFEFSWVVLLLGQGVF